MAEAGGEGGGGEREYSKGRREMRYGGRREGKGRANGAAEVRDEGRALSLLKVVAGRWDGT